jgi:cytochrome P450
MTNTERAAPRATIEFDHHSEIHASGPWPIWADLRSRCPVAWTESHGGFWVVSRHDDVQSALRDWETFSSVHETNGRFGGQAIPPYADRISFVEMDPPESTRYRRLVQGELSPRRVDGMRPFIHEVAAACLRARSTGGVIDLVADYVNQVPAKVILAMLGFSPEDWHLFAEPSHALNHATPGTAEHDQALRTLEAAGAVVARTVDARCQHPQDDLTSALAHAEIDGERVGRDDVVEMIYVLIMGGLETVTGTMGNALAYLDRNRAARQLLATEPERIPAACEEFLRFFTPSRAIARTLRTETELAGVRLRPGDRVLLGLGSGNHDETVFEDPEAVRLDRDCRRQLTFGSGVHRCPGDRLARVELQAVIEEALRLIPDYTIDHARTVPYRIMPMTTGFVTMPATFTPAGGSR